MQITQELVELMNAKLQDLALEVSMFNAIELAEDMELEGVDELMESLTEKLSIKFGKEMSESEEFHQALESLKDQMRITVQLDRLMKDFKTIGGSESILKEMEELKAVNMVELLQVLEIDQSEVENVN